MFKNALRRTLRKFPNYAYKMLGNSNIKISSAVFDIMQFFIVLWVHFSLNHCNSEYRVNEYTPSRKTFRDFGEPHITSQE